MITQLNELKDTTKQLIENICSRIEGIAELYQSGNDESANQKMIFLIEDLTALVEGAERLQAHVGAIRMDECSEKLNMLFQAYQTKDYLLTADLLKFELLPLFEYWSEHLNDE